MEPRRRTLLVVDDDRLLGRALADCFGDLTVHAAASAAEALELLARVDVDVVLLDEHLPDARGHELCEKVLRLRDHAKIIFITAYPSFEHAVQALKAGACDYLSKPFELEHARVAVSRCLKLAELERVGRLHRLREQAEASEAVLVGEGLAEVRRLAALGAGSDAPALVTGETGTGKTLVARALHDGGPRAGGPFVRLNCAALPETLVEAELLGWERGAFTGAAGAREGLLEMADGGTLLLDEIGEMPLHLQSKLLTVLEDREVKRLGGRVTRSVHVRFVAATNVEPERLMGERRLRPDLFYRLNVVRVHIPPLRERPGDIPSLVAHFLARLGRGRAAALGAGELDRLSAYPWPGNVRELRNVIERALLVQAEPLRPSALLGPARAAAAPAEAGEDATLETIERRHTEAVLKVHGGNVTRAARALGVSLSTLKRRLKRFGRGPAQADPAASD